MQVERQGHQAFASRYAFVHDQLLAALLEVRGDSRGAVDCLLALQR